MASASRWVGNEAVFLLLRLRQMMKRYLFAVNFIVFCTGVWFRVRSAGAINAIYSTWRTHRQPTSPFFIATKNRFPTSPFHAICILTFQFLLRIKRLSNQRPGDTTVTRIGNSWERNRSDKGSPVVLRCAASPPRYIATILCSTTFNFTKHEPQTIDVDWEIISRKINIGQVFNKSGEWKRTENFVELHNNLRAGRVLGFVRRLCDVNFWASTQIFVNSDLKSQPKNIKF